jgi:hypothetical protein
MGGFRIPQVCITFAGQSLNGGPVIGLANSYPHVLIASLRAQGIRATRFDTWTGGLAWLQLDEQPGRFAAAEAGAITIQCQVGGTTDYAFNATGEATYAIMSTIADEAHAAGFDYVIGTTTTPSVSIAGVGETRRLVGNGLMTDPAALVSNTPTPGPFDAVVDFCSDPDLDAYTDSGYIDQTHFSIPGAITAAGMMEDAILTLLAA